MISFWTWRLTVTAVLLVTPVLTVLVSVALEGTRNALSTSAFHQALAVTRAVDLVRLVHTVMAPITHPLSQDAAPIPAAMFLCGIAITVLLITQISTVIIPITYEAVIETLACVAVEQIVTAVAVSLVTPVITVVVAITLQLLWDAESTRAQEVLTASTQGLLSMFLLQ